MLDRGSRGVTQWFDTSAFSEPVLGSFGSAGRNIISLPGVNNWDFSLTKTVSVSERVNLEIRMESFNLFNHTQFGDRRGRLSGGVGTNFSRSSFGKITQARTPRTIMLGMRLEF